MSHECDINTSGTKQGKDATHRSTVRIVKQCDRLNRSKHFLGSHYFYYWIIRQMQARTATASVRDLIGCILLVSYDGRIRLPFWPFAWRLQGNASGSGRCIRGLQEDANVSGRVFRPCDWMDWVGMRVDAKEASSSAKICLDRSID